MFEFKINKCPKCGRLAETIVSNNPIAAGICFKCIAQEIDYNNLVQADFFCRTYNFPFDPNKWLSLVEKCGENVFKEYTKQFFETNNDNLYYKNFTADLWKKVNEEWQSCITFEEILSKVEKVKNSFMNRCKIKWGGNYTFEEYVQLENLLTSTLQANDITNPLQIDAIKKSCRISIELDKVILEGDSKGIQELSKAYANFTKTAQIDAVIAAANKEVIDTVASLAEYIEECGGQFTYYDNVDRDIVDKTIKDLKEYIRVLVQDSTGLTNVLESITTSYKSSLEQKATDDAVSNLSLEDIINNHTPGANADFDKDLAEETLDDIELEEPEEDDYFG